MPDGWMDRVLTFCEECSLLDDVEALLARNRIWFDRTADVGVTPRGTRFHVTGPSLGSGVDVDLRRDAFRSGYENYEFEVPLGENGDYDRYAVRMEEMRQSVRIVRQAIDKCHKALSMRKKRRRYLLQIRGRS